jgi:hypothetical protein
MSRFLRRIADCAARISPRSENSPTPLTSVDRLIAAHKVFTLLSHVRFVMRDAEDMAKDGDLRAFAPWIGGYVDWLQNELLPELTLSIQKLEAEARQ